MPDKYSVRLIESMEEWGRMSEDWNELLRESKSNTIFLTFEWLHTWAECFLAPDRKLLVLAVYEKDNLVGLAPWCVRSLRSFGLKVKQIEFLGTPEMGSDYMNLIIKSGKEKEVTDHIYSFLFNENPRLWDSMALDDIPCDSLFLLHLIEKVRSYGKHIVIQEGSFCPIAVLPDSWEDYFRKVSANRREQFSRHYRLLQQQGKVNYETIVQGVDKGFNLDRFTSLYRVWWGKKQGEQFYIHLKKFSERCTSQSWIQMDFLSVDGRDVAAMLHCRYDKALLMYLMAVDKAFNEKISIGNILVGLCLEKAISNGISTYDFLKGNEAYKFHWANSGRRSLTVKFYQRHLSSLGKLSVELAKDFARVLLR